VASGSTIVDPDQNGSRRPKQLKLHFWCRLRLLPRADSNRSALTSPYGANAYEALAAKSGQAAVLASLWTAFNFWLIIAAILAFVAMVRIDNFCNAVSNE
jgi:hypothetical protein